MVGTFIGRTSERLRPRSWGRLSFSSQFLAAAGAVLFVAMAVLGTWITEQIKQSVLQTSGAQGAQFMARFLQPHVQDLTPDGMLSPQTHALLDALFIGTPAGESVISIKIWRTDGTVIYGTSKDLIGQKFVSSEVERAAAGMVVAEYEDITSDESAHEQALGMALIEVYGPLYRSGTREVLAVGEIYENADALAAELGTSRMRTWAVVCFTTLLMLAVLYLIVRRGDRTILAQRSELRQHVSEARQLANQNEELRLLSEKARLDASEANEQLLARIGSDLHDGPIQLMTLLTLKLSSRSLTRHGALPPALEADIASVQQIADEAIAELRNISSGLSLPEIGAMSLDQALRSAVAHYIDMTGDPIVYEFRDLDAPITEAAKICAYRVIQEGLNNAYKHAEDSSKSVTAHIASNVLTIEVRNTGGHAEPPTAGAGRQKLGLAAMRNRVGALKGSFEMITAPDTRIIVRLPIGESTLQPQ